MTNERKFDPAWPHGHVTRDGRKARIVATDYQGDKILAIATTKSGHEEAIVRWVDGRLYNILGTITDHDLINAPEPVQEMWVNVYPTGIVGTGYSSRVYADECASPDRIACIGPIQWRPGEGLE